MNNDSLLLDQITFMAGLASSTADIDPLLEVVRTVTSRQKVGEPLHLSEGDRKELTEVQTKLKDHLIHKDSLRKFTPETLQNTLDDQFSKAETGHLSPLGRVRRQFRSILIIIGLVFVVSAGILFALNVPFWWLLAASCTVTAMFISSCWLFLAEYSTFTPALRRAYAWICVGVVLLGVSASLWMVFTSIHEVYNVPILRYGLNYWMFGLAFVAAYMGVRAFARAQNIRSPLASLAWVVPGSVIVCVIVAFLPHISTADDQYLQTTVSGGTLISFYGYVIALLAAQVSRTLTPTYARAMTWLSAGYALSATVGIAGLILLLVTGTGFGIKLVVMGMFYATGGVLVFIAGYLFRLSSAGQTKVLSRE